MVFSTIIFLFRFLPITLALYYLAPAKLKNTVLFLCSLVFYCWGEVRFFPVMVALILINYLSGLAIEHFDAKPALRRFFLLVALVGSLGMLFYFKYANFVLRSANALLGTAFAEIQGIGTLPLGISFYTFQTLSYSIDVYRRDVKAERNIIDFGAVPDGVTLNTQAINNAIKDVNKRGGGKVVIPAGLWLSGPIELLSNVNLYTEKNALVLFTDDHSQFPIIDTSFEGLETRRCQSPISARNAENIAITGHGTFDGNGDTWRPVKMDKLTESQWKKKVA